MGTEQAFLSILERIDRFKSKDFNTVNLLSLIAQDANAGLESVRDSRREKEDVRSSESSQR